MKHNGNSAKYPSDSISQTVSGERLFSRCESQKKTCREKKKKFWGNDHVLGYRGNVSFYMHF